MFDKPIAKTLAALGFHGHAEEDRDRRAVFAEANGETPAAVAPPPARIPPHQRHLYAKQDDALRGYSMGVYRPAASLAQPAQELVAKKPAKARKRANGVPKGDRLSA